MIWRRHLLSLLILVLICELTCQYKLVCYFSNQSQYERLTRFRFFADDVPACLCTHIHFAYAQVENNGLSATEFNDDIPNGSYEQITNLKNTVPNLKVLLSVGGRRQGSLPFIALVSNNQLPAFARNVVSYLRTYNFDGIDIAWEFPSRLNNPTARYTDLIRELRTAFDNEASTRGVERLLLAVTLASKRINIDDSYDIPAIEPFIDYANLLTYNYHNGCEDMTGLNAPLYGRMEEIALGGSAAELNQNWTVNYYLGLGLPAEKINLGIPSFGVEFTLDHVANDGVGSATQVRTNCVADENRLPYFLLCEGLNEVIESRKWIQAFDTEHQAPFASYGRDWITYENGTSVTLKAQYIINHGLGGAMVWSLDRDDFSNNCGEGSFPLINSVRDMLGPTTDLCAPTTPAQTTTTPIPTRSSTVPQDFSQLCQIPGQLLPVNTDCRQYVRCVFLGSPPIWFVQNCPSGTFFSTATSRCELDSEVSDCPGYIPPVTTASTAAIITTSSVPATTTIPRRNSTETQIFSQLCQTPGQLLPVNTDCRKYVQCAFIGPPPIWFTLECPSRTYFSLQTSRCEFISEVIDCPGYIAVTTTQLTTPMSVTTVPVRDSTDSQDFSLLCQVDGQLLPVNADCRKYVECTLLGSPPFWIMRDCPAGTFFSTDTSRCELKSDVRDCPGYISPLTPVTTTADTIPVSTTTLSTLPQVTTQNPPSTTPERCAITGGYRLVCFVTNADYFPQWYPSSVDPYLCTHLIYAFASLSNDAIAVTQQDITAFRNILALRAQNPNLKIMLSLGGWGHLQGPFEDMLLRGSSTAAFVQSVINLLRLEQFDGFDLAWIYPATSQLPFKTEAYTVLIRTISEEFAREAMTTSQSRLLFSVSTAALKDDIDDSYNIAEIDTYVDFVNILSFDYHLTCEPLTGMNAPLYAGRDDIGTDSATLNQNWTINYYIANGLSREKINMGIPTYARKFLLDNPINNGPGSLTSGADAVCQRQSGVVTFLLLCALSRTYQLAWDDVRKVPFSFDDRNSWMTYENVTSIAWKANFIKDMGLGGAMVWSLNEDDHRNVCGLDPYPLVNRLKCTLAEVPTTPATTAAPTTAACSPPVVPRNSNAAQNFTVICVNGQLLPYNPDCRSYVRCQGNTWVIERCPNCLYFDPVTQRCVSPGTVTDCISTSTISPSVTTSLQCVPPLVPRNSNTVQDFDAICTNGLLLPYNPDCRKFVQCEPGGWQLKDCAGCLFFNTGSLVCDFLSNVNDCGPGTPITAVTVSPTTADTCIPPVVPRNSDATQNFTVICVNGQLLPYNPDCRSYVRCQGNTWVIERCPNCLYFDPVTQRCVSPGTVTDCISISTISPSVTTSLACVPPLVPRNSNTVQDFDRICVNGQLLPYNPDCRSYVRCQGNTWVIERCPNCLYFDPLTQRCVSPGTVTDCISTSTISPSVTTSLQCVPPLVPRNSNAAQDFDAICTNGLLLPYNPDCRKFVQCEPGGWQLKDCAGCLFFNTGSLVCDFLSNVTDCGAGTPITAVTVPPTTADTCIPPVVPRNSGAPQNFDTLCPSTDLLPYNPDCRKYVQCVGSRWEIRPCPGCLFFNRDSQTCDFIENVRDCNIGSTAEPSTLSTPEYVCYAPEVPRIPTDPQDFDNICVLNLLLPYNPDCRKFVHCEHRTWVIKICQECLYFNKDANVCDFPENIRDCIRPNQTEFTLPTQSTISSLSTFSTTEERCYVPERPRNSDASQNFFDICFFNRLLPYNPDCRQYVHCQRFGWAVKMCPECLYYNPSIMVCDYPENVPDCMDIKTVAATGPTMSSVSAETTTATPCSAPVRARASSEPQDFYTLCKLAGDGAHLPVNTDCSLFVHCVFTGIFRPIYFTKLCPPCQYFHIDSNRCELPNLVTDCQDGSVPAIGSGNVPTTPGECDFDGSRRHSRRGLRLVQNFYSLCKSNGKVFPVYNDCSCYVQCTGAGTWTVSVCPVGQFYDRGGFCVSSSSVTECR